MNRIEDFEWEEMGMDRYVFSHKLYKFSIATITNFNGWEVNVHTYPNGKWRMNAIANNIDSLEAAKMVAAVHINLNFEGYPDAKNYGLRALPYSPKRVPKGVFKVG